MKIAALSRWRTALGKLSGLLPGSCALCARPSGESLCSGCRQRYFATVPQRCPQCALPLPGPAAATRCGDCLAHPPAFDYSIAACDYAAPLDQLVLALKFGHRLALAPLLAHLLRDAILRCDQAPLPDLLCVVPLGRLRLQERGFNQALEIARPLARQLGIALDAKLLFRSRETAPQSSLPPGERARNVRQVFVPHAGALERIRGAHIAVVDDVMTTGVTLHEVATILKHSGAARVSNFVVARTPFHPS